MNRKANVPFFIMFISAIAIFLILGVNFAYFNDRLSENTNEINSLYGALSVKENYIFEVSKSLVEKSIIKSDFKKTFIEESQKLSIFDEGTNFFAKIRNEDFVFELREIKGNEVYSFQMKDVFVVEERGLNKVKRNFDIEIEINKE